VANSGADNIAIIDVGTQTVTHTLQIPKIQCMLQTPTGPTPAPTPPFAVSPQRLAINGESGHLYVTTAACAVLSASTTSHSFTEIPDLSARQQNDIVSSATGMLAYVANASQHTIDVLDVGEQTVTKRITGITNPTSIAVAPTESKLYVTDSDADTVSLVDLVLQAVTSTTAVGEGPRGMALSTDGKQLYIASTGRYPQFRGRLSILDTRRFAIVRDLEMAEGPQRIVVSPDGNHLYVLRSGLPEKSHGSVVVVETASLVAESTVPVGRGPQDIDISPNGSLIYVTNFDDDTVSVIDTTMSYSVQTIMFPDCRRLSTCDHIPCPPGSGRCQPVGVRVVGECDGFPSETPTPAIGCVGDCNHDGVVTVDEIVTAVNILLNGTNTSECVLVDQNNDGSVSVDEVIQGVRSVLLGCRGE
jgi:YVTN family beta-propeller protein